MKLNCKVLTCRFVLKHKLSVFFFVLTNENDKIHPYANNAKI